MAGWASRNKYSLLGGMRAVAQMVSYEIPLVLSAVIVVMMVGSLNAGRNRRCAKGLETGSFSPRGASLPLSFSSSPRWRKPTARPSTSQRQRAKSLPATFTEYSGFKFALFFLAEYIAMFAISGLTVTLFLGGGDGPGLAVLPWLSVIWFLAKIFALIAVMIWLRGTLPRLRVDQLMGFAWKFMLPLSILNISLWPASLGTRNN